MTLIVYQCVFQYVSILTDLSPTIIVIDMTIIYFEDTKGYIE